MNRWQKFTDWCRAMPQYVAPQHGLSRLMHRLAASERPWLAQRLIRTLMAHYPIDLRDALEPEPTHYRSLNAFFTRALRPGARPLPADPLAFVSPADGILNQCGVLTDGRILQAKGRDYAVSELLATPGATADPFQNGVFGTIYLAPHNYHRVHAPCDCTITEIIYVPGDLFSVNPRTAATVPNLFARNERVVLLCSSAHGELAIVLVGAMLVGSMTLACWDLASFYRKRCFNRQAFRPGLPLQRGAELGRFNMGSTVILVLGRQDVTWDEQARVGQPVKVGQALGRWRALATQGE